MGFLKEYIHADDTYLEILQIMTTTGTSSSVLAVSALD